MKTIGFELSKKLNDLGLLDNIDTEYYISEIGNNILYSNKEIKDLRENFNAGYVGMFKTLTLEEAIEFLPKNIILKGNDFFEDGNYFLNMKCNEQLYYFIYNNGIYEYGPISEDGLITAIEKMIEYLLENNLLTK